MRRVNVIFFFVETKVRSQRDLGTKIGARFCCSSVGDETLAQQHNLFIFAFPGGFYSNRGKVRTRFFVLLYFPFYSEC